MSAKLHLAHPIPTKPTTKDRHQYTKAFHLAVDRAIAGLWQEHHIEAAAENKPPLQLGCVSGCAACCTFAVDCTWPEAEFIAAHIQAQPLRQRTAVLLRLYAWLARYHQHQVHQQQLGTPVPVAVARWQIHRYACPFLELKSHRCSIYGIRPTPCRSHHAVWPPDTEQAASFGIRDPGDGCFTQSDDIDGTTLRRTVWMLDAELTHKLGKTALDLAEQLGGERECGPLALLVLRVGQAHYGWQQPQERLPAVPTLRRSKVTP